MTSAVDCREGIQATLIKWFGSARRDYPWRHAQDPYAILLAERLLQQTAARECLVDAYEQLLRKYPSPTSLAQADLSELEAAIRPLGFVYRAGLLRRMAQELVDRHAGLVPQSLNELLSLTGVGDYAARAVLSFAFGQDIAVVDTNVARFLYRLYGIEGPLPANPSRKRRLIELANSLVPPGHSKDYNLAVLDLGAQVCTPKKPKCVECPVNHFCAFYAQTASIALETITTDEGRARMTELNNLEPWKAVAKQGGVSPEIDVLDGLARIATFWPGAEQEAHVRLFLAAPMLLEACKAALRLAGDGDLPDNGEYSGAAITDLIRAAVEKASS